MNTLRLTINDREIEVPEGSTILEAAQSADIYIPTLCHHPDLPPAAGAMPAAAVYQGPERKIENARPEEEGKGCGLCVVSVEGEPELVGGCATPVKNGMVVVTEGEAITRKRRENLKPILARHRHACLTCAQQEGCPRTQCSSNVPEEERCCPRFGHCELQDVANYVGISEDTPKWVPTDLPILKDDPLFERDYNLCIGCTRCVRACRDLRGIEAIGFVTDENGRVQVGTLAPTLAESACRFCTACVEVCPTGALMDKNIRPGKKAEDLVACKTACPAGIDVPEYIRCIAGGRPDLAAAVIREKVPFPGILGRVCARPCEDACRRGEVNEPIAVCALKRYAAGRDDGSWKQNQAAAPDTGRRVAVVGAGPAGLTAAYYLRKKGHAVTVFDENEKPGGMMRYGIPAYRLPAEVIDAEVGEIFDTGIAFSPRKQLGRDFTHQSLKADGFDAVFLAVGAKKSRQIPLEGCDAPDVLPAVEFLNQVAAGHPPALKDRVIVIGGGNVAVDSAMTALRCGATDVRMICLESAEEMPASPWEIENARAEGIRVMPSWGPNALKMEDGRITAVECVECTAVFDDEGNFNPAYSEETCLVEGDQVILAVGQAPDLSFLQETDEIDVQRGMIVVDGETMHTGMDDIYAGGDVVKLPGIIVQAVAAGRKAASAIDAALAGDGNIEETLISRKTPTPRPGRMEGFARMPRVKISEVDPELRKTDFRELALPLDTEAAALEAGRCLQCDLRLYMASNPEPPTLLFEFTDEIIQTVPDAEGVYQLLDAEKTVIAIKGTANLRDSLLEELTENDRAAFFEFEEDKMYSQRESELIQRYLAEHGEMPGGDLDDDLF